METEVPRHRRGFGSGWVVVVCLIAAILLVVLYNRLAGSGIIGKADPLKAGLRAPNFELPSIVSGEIVSLSRLRGRPNILFFFSASCASCEEEMPFWFMVKSKYDSSKLGFYGVCSSSMDDIEKFYRRTGVRFPVLLDHETAVTKLYDVASYPELYLLDPNGNVAFRSNHAAIDEGVQILDNKLNSMIGG